MINKGSTTIVVEGMIFASGFSKKYDLSLLSIKGRVLDWCRAFDRLASIDAHLWPVQKIFVLPWLHCALVELVQNILYF